MAGEVTFEQINGLSKDVYDASGLKTTLFTNSWFQDKVTWDKGTTKLGDEFRVGVVTQPPNGFTYGGSAGGITTLLQPRGMKVEQTSSKGFELVLRERMAWGALSRAAAGGIGAFASLVGEAYKAMKLAMQTRVEIDIIHGQQGLGVVDSVNDLGSGVGEIVLTEGSFAPGMWYAIGKNAPLDAFTSTTKNNATGPLVLQSVNSKTRTLTVLYSGTFGSEVAGGDVLFFQGAYDGTTHYSPPGLIAQYGNLTGESMGINASTTPNWAGNTFDFNGEISTDKLEECFGDLRDRGATGRLWAVVPTKGFSKLMSEAKTQRVFDSSYSPEKAKFGHKTLEAETDEFGAVGIHAHSFLKRGQCLVFSPDDTCRLGSSEIKFGQPDSEDAPTWQRVQDSTASEVVMYSEQSPLTKMPKNGLVGSGITYAST